MITIEELKKIMEHKKWYMPFSKTQKPELLEIKSYIIELTSFLSDSAKLTTRGWHIKNDMYHLPLCKQCNINHPKWDAQLNSYRTYCSTKCAALSPSTKDRRKETTLEKYGVNYITQTDNFKNKVKETNLEKYGVTTTLKHEGTLNKIKETLKKKYGVDHNFKVKEIRAKIKTTMLEKYGVENPKQNEEIKQKGRETNLKKYGVEYPASLESTKEKAKVTNLKKYGVTHHARQHLSEETIERLKDKDWLIEQHHKNKLSITEIANMLGMYDTTLNGYFRKYDIETKYYYSSIGEKAVREYISVTNMVEHNIRNVIYPYELDVYVPDKQLAIEYCGLYWHSEFQCPKEYHSMKYNECKKRGIKLITIFANEWENNSDLIKTKLDYLLHQSKSEKIFARKCKIVIVDKTDKESFFNKHHIQGNGSSSINYGLEYNDELIAVIGFIKNNDNSFTLNRYATSCNVVGGFTRLLSMFEREYNKPKIITFADLRWSEGDLYYKSGFIMDKELKPDYYWADRSGYYHKFNFRHTTGLKKLKNYDPNLTEVENMHNHGYYRIYDCGKLRFIKN